MNKSKSNSISGFLIAKPSAKIYNSKITSSSIYILSFTLGLISPVLLSFSLKVLFVIFIWLSFYIYLLAKYTGKLEEENYKLELKKSIILNEIVISFIIIGFYLEYPQFGIMYLFYLTGIILSFYSSNNDILVFPNKFENFIVFTLMILFPKYIFYILGLFNLIIFYRGFKSLYKEFFMKKETD